MSSIYIFLKDIFIIFTPFVIIDIFFRHFYQTNIFSVISWWFKYHPEIEYKAPLFMGFAFMFFAFWVTIGFFTQTVSLSFSSETHDLVYIGTIEKGDSLFVKPENIHLPPIQYHAFGGAKPYYFTNIFRKAKFLRDKGSDRLGAPVSEYTFNKLFSTIIIMVALFPLLILVLHNLAYLVSIKAETVDFEPDIHTMDAFIALLTQWKLDPFKLIGITIGSIIFFFIFSYYSSNNDRIFDNRIIELPREITPGYEIEAIPINQKRRISESPGSSSFDTGFRTIIFKFNDIFPLPVYVSYYYDSAKRPNLEQLADINIKNGKRMKVKVLDDLSIEVVD